MKEGKRSVVISFNWETRETMHTVFEGDGCVDHAVGWSHLQSFLWKDFPARDGWTHFYHATPEAMKERGDKVSTELLEKGSVSVDVPI